MLHISAFVIQIPFLHFAGPILHSPVMDVQVQLHQFEMAPGTALPVISACAAQCIHKMFEEAECYLMEPVMFMEVCEFPTKHSFLLHLEKSVFAI